jgi:hypothetical protein
MAKNNPSFICPFGASMRIFVLSNNRKVITLKNFNKMERKNFHQKDYGWNFYVETAQNGKTRVGRYFTNGHQNQNGQVLDWKSEPAPQNYQEARDRFETDDYHRY